MSERDKRGRFVPGNSIASKGGRARAERLSPQRRKEIAKMGFRGLVKSRFDGDLDRAREWPKSSVIST